MKRVFWKLGNREDYSFKLIEVGDGDILPDKKTQLGNKVLLELMSEKIKLTYQEIAKKINCNDEHARRICIKLFTEGKIEKKIKVNMVDLFIDTTLIDFSYIRFIG